MANYGVKFSELPRQTNPVSVTFNIPGVASEDGKNYFIQIQDILGLIDKTQLQLDKVDNTSDLEKPISLAVAAALATKSDSTHVHTFGQIEGLQEYLDTRFSSHTHPMSSVVGLEDALATKSNVGHHHQVADIDGLQASLDSKADKLHAHSLTDINGAVETVQALWAAVDGKADRAHGHTVNQIVGFDGAVRDVIQSEHPNLIIVDVGAMEW